MWKRKCQIEKCPLLHPNVCEYHSQGCCTVYVWIVFWIHTPIKIENDKYLSIIVQMKKEIEDMKAVMKVKAEEIEALKVNEVNRGKRTLRKLKPHMRP